MNWVKMKITFEQEKKVIVALLEKMNVPNEQARFTAEVLAEGDVRGFASHGLLRLPYILNALKRGTIVANAEVKIVKETPATALLDGGHGLGHYVAAKAMQTAIEKAKKVGVGAVGVNNTNHFGIAGYYVEMAVRDGMIGIVTTTTDALVHPWGGVEPLLGTNALAMGFPTEPPAILDMAMSVAARGKLVDAMKNGQKIPESWAVDSEGRPTTDPSEGLKGALSPFGGPKGYALAFAMELLAGSLVGAGLGKGVDGTLEPVKGYSTKGDFMIVINPDVFASTKEFKERTNEYIKEIKSSNKAPNVKEIMIPGEPEQKTRTKNLAEGITIGDAAWSEIEKFANELGVELKSLL